MKAIRFRLRHFMGGFTLAAILCGAAAYIVDECRQGQINAFRRVYLEGRVSKVTAREYVGDLVDSWPDMPPIQVSPRPWQQRYKTAP